ncbi:photosystem II stability/assembly factor-like uncharacterized protein [Panacagrimonas perspica]|uniref:Photosystem II stability/assembly factor-like uncharacterized protein n=1 Tax=Panacagrimonas perspica TaxID=381431 RepID=A0A4R7PAG5_9GAMM|nr:YCF48-related protein [Panacagrimonas perspica]TDU31035.1 photosystem II stability/assembly factor-like uncharacterized protein [Panacagrimonas perspica]THD01818.1 hypothetical protein B1810_17600 [Panacagrimonas perspica]
MVIKTIAGVLLLAVLVANSVPGRASQAPTEVVNGIPHQSLFGIAFDEAKGVAVGAAGQILSTRDAGKSWTTEATPNRLGLLGVAVRGERRIAVGQMGQILLKEGEGSWQIIDGGTQERLMAVSLNAAGEAVIVGSFGLILTSRDGGRTWVKGNPDWSQYFAADAAELGDDFKPHFYAVTVSDERVITVVGELGLILRSYDGGCSWTVLHRGDQAGGTGRASLFAMDLRGDGKGYVVGQGGLVLTTADGGTSWTKLDIGTEAHLLGVATSPGGDVVVTAMREVLTSRDGGTHWQKQDALDIKTGWYNAAARQQGTGAVFAVGHSGRIIRFAE